MDTVAWIIFIVCVGLGLAGTIVPLLPGTILIFLGPLTLKLFVPDVLSWVTVAVVGVGTLFAWALDFIGSIAGAKWGGVS